MNLSLPNIGTMCIICFVWGGVGFVELRSGRLTGRYRIQTLSTKLISHLSRSSEEWLLTADYARSDQWLQRNQALLRRYLAS